jgi:hypothetical protein
MQYTAQIHMRFPCPEGDAATDRGALEHLDPQGNPGCDLARPPRPARPGNARGSDQYPNRLPRLRSVGNQSLGAADPEGRPDHRVMLDRSPDEAKRNPGTVSPADRLIPGCASLHPGYGHYCCLAGNRRSAQLLPKRVKMASQLLSGHFWPASAGYTRSAM